MRINRLSTCANKSPNCCLLNTYHGEVLEGAGSLNVLQGLLEVDQLGIDLALGLLGVLDGLGLKGIDGLQLAADIVRGGLEALEVVLDLVDDSLVLQDTTVVGEVNGLGLLRQDLDLAAGIVVALLEGLQRGGGLAAEAEGGRNLGPVDLESGTALFRVRRERALVSGWIHANWAATPHVREAHSLDYEETYSCHCVETRDVCGKRRNEG